MYDEAYAVAAATATAGPAYDTADAPYFVAASAAGVKLPPVLLFVPRLAAAAAAGADGGAKVPLLAP